MDFKRLFVGILLVSGLAGWLKAEDTSVDVSLEPNLFFLANSKTIIGSAKSGDIVSVPEISPLNNQRINGEAVAGEGMATVKSQTLKTNNKNDIVVLQDGKHAILMAHTFSGKQQIILGSNSTAVSLVLLNPALLGLTPDQQEKVVTLIKKKKSFSKLVKRVKYTIEHDREAPLDYFIHPFLGQAVQRVVNELIASPDFKNITSLNNVKTYQNEMVAPSAEAEQNGFAVSCQDDEDQVVSCAKATKLSIDNPKSVYYGVYIDEDKSDILDAKEAYVNVDLGLYPPKFDLTLIKTTDFSFSTFDNNEDSYNIYLTREFDWNPLTAKGSATWMNAIKGLSLAVELAGLTPSNSKKPLFQWISNNANKLKEMGDNFANKELARTAVITIKAINYLLGQIYENLDNNNQYKEGIGEIYYTVKRLSTLADKIIDLLKLDPLSNEELISTVNYEAEYIFGYKSVQEMVVAVRSGNEISILYQKITEEVSVKIRSEYSKTILNWGVHFNYDYAMQKISALLTQLDTNGMMDSVLKVLLNDFTNDTAKLIANTIIKNMLGLPYKLAVASNKLVPYTWDMFMAPKTLKFPVYNGELKAIPEPTLELLHIEDENHNTITPPTKHPNPQAAA